MNDLPELEIDIINNILSIKTIDYSKLQYNQYYKTTEFWSRKFPQKMRDEPSIKELIQYYKNKAIENDISPLQEINNRIKNLNINN